MLVRNKRKSGFRASVLTAFKRTFEGLSMGALLSILALACALMMVRPAMSQDASVEVLSDRSASVGYVGIPVNKSKVLRIGSPFKELMVGNQEVADVLAMSDRTLYILGKSVGSTSLLVYGPRKNLIAVLDLQVTPDTQGLKYDLFNLMPDENVNVRGSAEGIVLSGRVKNSLMAKQAQDLAERYAPDNVSNFLSVEQSQQVMLTVRFAEVKRSVAKQLGLNSDVFLDNGGGEFMDMMSGILSPDAFATAFGRFITGDYTIDVWLDALEDKGVMTTLAEPTLIALSGEEASFLAGGEFPIPVAQQIDESGKITTTIEFKEFGVSLGFKPTVIGDLISLAVAPEVSALDEQAGVEFDGLRIPGLVTRRALTTVELRDGQSFAIAGLLQSEFKDNIKQFPGLGDVPILGALLRSTDYQRSETELVIIVTPHLVRPVSSDALNLPTDLMDHPSEVEMFMLGFMEGHLRMQALGRRGSDGADMTTMRGGGLDGSLGYINEEGASK